MNISVQLYTLREVIKNDLKGHFEQIKQMGYDYVELAGFYDLKAIELKHLLDDAKLVPISSHVGLRQLESHYEDVVKQHKTLGIKHIVIPYTEIKDRTSYLSILPKIRFFTYELIKEGFTVHYHNHANEFQSFDGIYLIEHLLNDVKDIHLEFDVYWAKVAKIDIDHFIERHQERILLLHAKDYQEDKNGQPYFESVGEGQLDFQGILKKLGRLAYVIVENDQPINHPMDNIKASITYLKQLSKEK